MIAPAQPFQFGDVAANESFLFRAGPSFELEFASCRGKPGGVAFSEDEGDGQAGAGELAASAFGVAGKAGGKVRGAADVEGVVGAAEDVDE